MTQSQYLIQTTEIYRVESEAAAVELIEAAKQDKNFALISTLMSTRKRSRRARLLTVGIE